MLQYKITLTNFYTLAVTITILSNLNNNKILVNSYQLNSHHHPHITDDLSRTTPSSSTLRLPSTSTVFHENKLNHHLNLDNTNYNAQQQLQQMNNKFQQQQHLQNSYESSNRKHNLGINKKYLHHQPSTSISSKSLSSEKSVQQKYENKEYYNDLKDKKYLREIYNPSQKSTSFKSLSTSSIVSNDNLHHHRTLDEATHPFSYSLPTHIANANQKISTSTNKFHHNQNGNSQKNPQSHYSHEHQLNSEAINLRKKSYSTPTISSSITPTTLPIKLHRELNQHKILDQHQHPHHHSHQFQSPQHHRHHVNPSVNIQKIKDFNTKQEKLHSITLSSKSHNKTMTPSATNVKGVPLPLTLNGKNSLQQQQHHEKKQHQHKHSTTMDVNESKSKFHHTNKKETTPKHSIESSIRQHHLYNQHNINQYHQDIVNKNVDKIYKTHKTNSDRIDHDNDDSKINNSDNDDRNDDDDNDDEEEDDEDYYYDEDRKNYNHNDYDNDNDDNNLELEVKGGDGGNSGKEQEKSSYNPHKRIILNRDYHEQNRYINKNKNIDNVDDDDEDDDSDSNDENIDEQYEDNNDDIDLIKKDLINHELFNNFERDFDLYDYIDDEPHDDDNNTTNTEKSSNLTQEKWEKLGTPQAVANSRRRYYSQVQRVNAHIMRVGYEAECRVPKPKIIQISEPSKRYVPHCTVLHRCSDDTGCCQSDFRTCVMKKSQTVDLYFYVVPLGMKEPIVETLSFENHTECHCVERERSRPQINRNDTINSMQNEQQITTTTTTNSTDNINSCQCAKHFTVFEENNRYENSDYHDTDNYDTRKLKKKCRCDCVSNDDVCQSFKQGVEGFPVEERRCISENRCLIPTCEYGEYANGRCPKTKQKRYIRTWHFD